MRARPRSAAAFQNVQGLTVVNRKGRCSSASEYVRDLIRADERRKAEEQLEALLLEGLKGEQTVMDRADWQAIRDEALARLKKARKGRG